MQTLKLRVRVENRRIATELPPDVPDGNIEVEIHYEVKPLEDVEHARRTYLEALFADINAHSPNLSREEIDRQIAEERASWGQ